MAAATFGEKMIQGLKAGPKFLKELKEFDNLIRGIGECKSKAEEDRIIVAEVELLKQRLSDPKLDKTRGKEYMVRLIYCEMLGHDVSFAFIKAVQFASESNILTKKAAYLALSQFLDHNSELVLLLVNTLLSDLKSDNFINVTTALVMCTKLIGPDLINAVYPVVVERLKHPKEHVRKKAIMALHRFQQFDPRHEGPLSGIDLDRHFRNMLCDKDPSVMSASLCALYDCVRQDPKPYKNLIASFTSILKQVSEHRLPKSYDYHRFPAPFIQIKLLKILAALGAGDRAASENMYAVIQQTLRRANNSHTIGNALIYECVRTITTIHPNPALLASAAESISGFLRSSSHNLRYVGIDALAGVVRLNPAVGAEHQLAVVDCLEDPDDTLRLKTLELLYKMTRANNVEVIVERMMGYLRTATDEHIRRDIVRKVGELAERYAPSPSWFMAVMSEVFLLGGEHVDPSLSHSLTRLIAEQEGTELHRAAVDMMVPLLDKPKLPDVLLQVICWVVGEYGHLSAVPAPQVMDRMVAALEMHAASDTARGYGLCAIAKLAAHTGMARGGGQAPRLTPRAEELVHKSSSSQNVELQQRAHELQALLGSTPALLAAVLPVDGSCEDISEAEVAAIRGLTWLEGHVAAALASGAAPYVTEEQRAKAGHVMHGANGEKGGHLRFEAYETTAAPVSAPPAYSGSSPLDDLGVSGSGPSSANHSGPAPTTATGAGGEPQLLLKAHGGMRRWGPAQYEGSQASSAVQASAASSTSRAGGNNSSALGDLLGAATSAAGPTTLAHQQHNRPVTERDRLAASIFGSAANPAAAPGTSGSRPTGSGGGARASAAAPAVMPDLLGLSLDEATVAPAGPAATPAPAPKSSHLDLLMDLGAPVPNSNAAPTTRHSQQPSYDPFATSMQHVAPLPSYAAHSVGTTGTAGGQGGAGIGFGAMQFNQVQPLPMMGGTAAQFGGAMGGPLGLASGVTGGSANGFSAIQPPHQQQPLTGMFVPGPHTARPLGGAGLGGISSPAGQSSMGYGLPSSQQPMQMSPQFYPGAGVGGQPGQQAMRPNVTPPPPKPVDPFGDLI